MNTVLMYDSISRKWPAGAKYILAYIDNDLDPGNYEAAVATGATVISISITGISGAHVYDIEPGCIWPPENGARVLANEVKIGHDPCAYMSVSNQEAIASQLTQFSVSPAQVDWGGAHFDNIAVLPAGYVFKQYASNDEFDTSIVSLAWIERITGIKKGTPMFINSQGKTWMFVANGLSSFWRQVPVAPTSYPVEADPSNVWFNMWDHEENGQLVTP